LWIFEHPLALVLLALIPIAIWARHFWRRRGGRVVYPFRIWGKAGFDPGLLAIRVVYGLASIGFWIGVALLVVALAGPARVSRERVFLNRGLDMMIVLDESPSMAAQDFVPDHRFSAAKSVIRRFINERENDAIGLVTFSREAALRVPLTLDYQRLLSSLEELQIMSLGDGTAIGMGLALAALHLRPGEAEEKVIVLLTDGKNNSGEVAPESAAQIASQLGMRVFTIGIGSKEPAPIEFTDPRTGEQYQGTFEEGFDEQLLRTVAETTGGTYFYAGTSGTLDAVFQSIDSIATVEKRARIEVQRDPAHRLFLMIGLGLILVEFLIKRWWLREIT
jgi:Ca-activated chloride channel family protein